MPALPSLYQSLRTIRTWLSVWAASQSARSYRVYELYDRNKLPSESSGYMNLGYWLDGCDTLDQAGDNLAELLAEEGGFTEGDRILDAGCGFGDQDFYWLHTRNPAKIVALNVTPRHVEHARERAIREGVAARLEFRCHSATAIDYAEETFDRVVAMESAFHFDPRQDFFTQAFRVLRRGGVLVTADLLPMDGAGSGDSQAPAAGMMGPLPTKLPANNWHSADVYRQHLLDAGFSTVSVRSIRDRVYAPWLAHMAAKVRTPEFQRKFGFAAKVMAREFGKRKLGTDMDGLDYVVVVAGK